LSRDDANVAREKNPEHINYAEKGGEKTTSEKNTEKLEIPRDRCQVLAGPSTSDLKNQGKKKPRGGGGERRGLKSSGEENPRKT